MIHDVLAAEQNCAIGIKSAPFIGNLFGRLPPPHCTSGPYYTIPHNASKQRATASSDCIVDFSSCNISPVWYFKKGAQLLRVRSSSYHDGDSAHATRKLRVFAGFQSRAENPLNSYDCRFRPFLEDRACPRFRADPVPSSPQLGGLARPALPRFCSPHRRSVMGHGTRRGPGVALAHLPMQVQP
jgi:hypothetical protein